MPQVKAGGALAVQTLLKKKGVEKEKAFLALLSQDTRDTLLYKSAATAWITYAQEKEVFRAASEILFPQDPQALRRLGHEVALEQFKGIYRVFMRIPTPEFVIKRVSKTWEVMHAQGKGVIENFTGKSAEFIVRDSPELTDVQREYICGYIGGVLELTGLRNVTVTQTGADPMAWKWIIRND